MFDNPIQKELLYISADKSVKRVDVGVFPIKGRYFRKEMKSKGKGYFQVTINLPKGKSFYHYFINGDFEKPVNNNLTVISEHDTHKRSPLVLETEMFSPIKFENNESFISHIKDDIWEIKAITYQQWIENVVIVINGIEHSLSKNFTYKNKSFWKVRVKLKSFAIQYYIKIFNKKQVRYLQKNYRLEKVLQPDNILSYNLLKETDHNTKGSKLGAGYQIVPDRFFNFEMPSTSLQLNEWGDTPDFVNFFGGTLKGITERLDYISDLGFDFIYLNPIVHSKSYHRYDSINYMKVDPLLGSEYDFEILINEIHTRGMKIILDISLNHCSTDFFAFKDLCKNEEKSKYLNWFEVEKFPLYSDEQCHYSCWHGYKELPQFNLLNQETKDYFMEVAKFWTKRFSIDGWRLDVCTEMPEIFVESFIDTTRKINPNAIIIAESWDNSMDIFSSDCGIDGLTNFSFYLEAITPFFIKENMSLKMLTSTLLDMNYKNSFKRNQCSWNFLSNHDLPRFQSVIKKKNKYALAYALLYALPGTPVVYYGEENRMEGLGDPLNRRCMEFEPNFIHDSENIYGDILRLNELKSRYKEIFDYGELSFPMVNNEKKLLMIQRSFNNERLLFYFNFDDVAHQLVFSSNTIELDSCSFELIHYDEYEQQTSLFGLVNEILN